MLPIPNRYYSAFARWDQLALLRASRDMRDIHALANVTPSVNLDAGSPFSADRSVLSASIRGIGQDDFAFNLDPSQIAHSDSP